MSEHDLEFNRRAVRPVECLREGWQLIKDDYWLFLGICLVGALIGHLVPMGILAGPMMCGINICLLRRMSGRPVKFDMLFRGFDHFLPSLLVGIVPIAVTLVLLPFFYLAIIAPALVFLPNAQNGGQPDALTIVLFLGLQFLISCLFSLVILFVQMLVMFACPLIVEYDLPAMEALRTSARAALANVFGLFGLMLINTLIGMVGLLACYVGAIFVLPLTYAAFAVAYRQVFPQRTNYEYLSRDEISDNELADRARPKDVLLVKDAIQASPDGNPLSESRTVPDEGIPETGIQGEPTRDPPL
jgi:hypothetical protein